MFLRTLSSIFTCILFLNVAQAEIFQTIENKRTDPQKFVPKPPSVQAKSYILLDADSGSILAEKNSKEKSTPASLTKMMSLYIISSHLTRGEINLDDKVKISVKAWKTEGSRTFVREGTYATVEDLIKGVVIQSGNDACVALTEHISGTTDAFVNLMNQQSKIFGMNDTTFTDPIGMPHKNQLSTTHDLAILTRALIKDFPQLYSWYKEKWFTYNGIKQPNRNQLLWWNEFIDGVKTGVTDNGGYVLAASGVKNGMRLIVVTTGAPSVAARTADGKKLFNYGYRFFESHSLYKSGEKVSDARIWYGEKTQIPAGPVTNVSVTIPTGRYDDLSVKLKLDKSIKAPITKGQTLGQLEITFENEIIKTQAIVALENNSKGNIVRRAMDTIKYSLSYIRDKIMG